MRQDQGYFWLPRRHRIPAFQAGGGYAGRAPGAPRTFRPVGSQASRPGPPLPQFPHPCSVPGNRPMILGSLEDAS